MSDLGAFESTFRRALRNNFEYAETEIRRVLIITDKSPEESQQFIDDIHRFLSHTYAIREYETLTMERSDFAPWLVFKQKINEMNPDLIVSYRLLWVTGIRAQKSLGTYIDLLSQDTNIPVLIMPHPGLHSMDKILAEPGGVIVATEHNWDDHRQVNFALRFAQQGQPLVLAHIEDSDTFEYYMDAVEKIPAIDTELARELIREQLLAGPTHYAESVIKKVKENNLAIQVITHIRLGHLITAYRKLMEDHLTDLLITNTKDDTQLAMHSIGYSLAVEFRETPILLL